MDSFPVDIRGAVYTLAFFSAKHLGESQYYLMTAKDKDGNQLQGNVNYRLNVPASVPVTQYWSMTVYNRDTHAFIRNSRWVGRHRRLRDYKRTSMVQSISTSVPHLRQVENRTGFLLTPMGSSRSWPASMVQKNLCSTRRGSCRISRKQIRGRLE